MSLIDGLKNRFQQTPQFGMSVQQPAAQPQQPAGGQSDLFKTAGGPSGFDPQQGGGVSVPPTAAFDGSTNQLGTDGSTAAAANAVKGINVAQPAIPPEGMGQKLQLFA